MSTKSRISLTAISFLLAGLLLVSCGGDGEQAQAPVVEGTAVVGDVLAFSLTPRGDWAGRGSFGWVQFRLREGRVNGEPVFFIRTDASNAAFAGRTGLSTFRFSPTPC